MVKLGLDIYQMFDVYCKEVRSILELAVPVWHPGLTKKNTDDIERIQRVAFKIILQNQYRSYSVACRASSTLALEERRENLSFARNFLKSKHPFFKRVKSSVNTRSKKNLVQEYRCRTSRYKKSSLPYLSKLLNNK